MQNILEQLGEIFYRCIFTIVFIIPVFILFSMFLILLQPFILLFCVKSDEEFKEVKKCIKCIYK